MLRKIYNFLTLYFWKPQYDHPSLKKVYHNIAKPFENITAAFEDNEINENFNNDNKKWYHNEYVYLLENNSLVEPSNKICIKGFRTLILETLSRVNDRPSLFRYLLFKLSFKKKLFIEKAVLFDGNTGVNYFHFFSDILPKIWVLEKLNLGDGIPYIIPKETFERNYFQYLLKNTSLKNKTWIVQDNSCWIEVKSLYLIKAYPYTIDYWKRTISLFNLNHSRSINKIFLTRSAKAGRYIKNMDEIENVLEKYNIEVIDTENLTFEEEIKTFSEAELIIGLHGAGNTNIIFSDLEKVKFIEIMPSKNTNSQYFWLANVLGINYDVLKGGALDENKAFVVNPDLLEKAILK